MHEDSQEVNDCFTEMRKQSQARRARNRANSPSLLKAAGLNFESRNGGVHLVVTHNNTTVDFWPGTGLWRVRGTSEKHRGVKPLVKWFYLQHQHGE